MNLQGGKRLLLSMVPMVEIHMVLLCPCVLMGSILGAKISVTIQCGPSF